MATIEQITLFHAERQNDNWPTAPEDREAAFLNALTYQRAFYPVKAILSPMEQSVFDDALALLALEMAISPPLLRASQAIKKLKEQSSTGAAIETEYEASTSEPYPLIAAMLRPLAVRPTTGPSIRISRMGY